MQYKKYKGGTGPTDINQLTDRKPVNRHQEERKMKAQ
jgi:hypothetical protein